MQTQVKNYENQVAQLTETIKSHNAEINRLVAQANQAHGAYLAFTEIANQSESEELTPDNAESAQNADVHPATKRKVKK